MRPWIAAALCAVAALFLVSPAVADEIEVMAMVSGPAAPTGVADHIVDVLPQSAVVLSGVPTSSWTYGCSATSAGMIFGYYDRHGFPNMWAGGVVPLTDLGNQTNLIATTAHVTDYWASYGSAGPDPWEGNWAEHAWSTCTADYMGTNQWKWDFDLDGNKDFNTDGSTALFTWNSTAKLFDYIPGAACGLPQTALCHGLRLFVESRGYQVVNDGTNYQNWTQKTDNQIAGGFSFADYMAEIDAGRPVMIQVVGHSMVGVGYDVTGSVVYLHDTWGDYVASMTWGGSYSGMDLYAVTVIHLVPEPATMSLVGLGILVLLIRRRRRID
jgi:hypothetical protein